MRTVIFINNIHILSNIFPFSKGRVATPVTPPGSPPLVSFFSEILIAEICIFSFKKPQGATLSGSGTGYLCRDPKDWELITQKKKENGLASKFAFRIFRNYPGLGIIMLSRAVKEHQTKKLKIKELQGLYNFSMLNRDD